MIDFCKCSPRCLVCDSGVGALWGGGQEVGGEQTGMWVSHCLCLGMQ